MLVNITGDAHWAFGLDVEEVSCIPFFISYEEVHSGSHLFAKLSAASEWAKVMHCIVECTNTLDHDRNGWDDLFLIIIEGKLQ